MDKRLIALCSLLGIFMTFVSFPEGGLSVFVVFMISVITISIIRKYADEKDFLTNVFLGALFFRIGLGLFIHMFDLVMLFGPDATKYNLVGLRLIDIWSGIPVPNDLYTSIALQPMDSGWGMNYLIGSIYYVFGPSILVAQSFCGAIGAITAPLTFLCAKQLFNNRRVAVFSAISIAVFPSFVIWSSQMLKDGLVIFLLVVVMTTVLRLQKKFNYLMVTWLILAMVGIISLRFYIFYMVAVAVVGSFVIGAKATPLAILRNIILMVILGLSMTYLGVIRNATSSFERFGNLESIQNSREELSKTASSGFGEDLDVSTTSGAIAAIPIGLAYLMFAPFPWQVTNLQQVLVLPETFLWWALIPVMISGIWYTIKYKLRTSIPILVFTLMLTLSYSIFQGNVGMIYRQRTQIQVFLFIFIAVGWSLFQERRENQRALEESRAQEFERKVRIRQMQS